MNKNSIMELNVYATLLIYVTFTCLTNSPLKNIRRLYVNRDIYKITTPDSVLNFDLMSVPHRE